MMKDFVAMRLEYRKEGENGLEEDRDGEGRLYERDMMSGSKIVEREMMKSFCSVQGSRSRISMGSRRTKRVKSRVMTEGTEHQRYQLEPFESMCHPLAIAEVESEEDTVRIDAMRKTKQEKNKFYEREASRAEERRSKEKGRVLGERRKMGEGKGFTYDY
jgi:hypothetical protein